MLRPVLALKLPESVRAKLQSLGYEYVEDIEQVLCNYEEASTQLKTMFSDHNIADKIVALNSSSKIISGASAWHSEFCDSPVAVFHEGLDKLLGGGLPTGRITELCGPPGCGKTQMCLQFCVDVQMPTMFGGSAGEALYISTDFGFTVKRLRQIIEATVNHCSTFDFPDETKKKLFLENFTPENLLDGVHVLRTLEVGGLLKALRNLKDFFSDNKKIKLLIIDSFSLPLVVEVEDLVHRSKIISEMLDFAQECAIEFNLAVVLTNQLMTVISGNNKTTLKPCLGEGFGHRMHRRLLLDDGKIYLTKSINRPQLFTCFRITQDGIR